MAALKSLARMIRSKNAGPFELTTDIIFEDERTYLRVKNSGVLNVPLMARIFGVEESKVHLVHYDPAYAIKVTVPRLVISGDPADSDVFGGQQYAPLVDLEIPEGNIPIER